MGETESGIEYRRTNEYNDSYQRQKEFRSEYFQIEDRKLYFGADTLRAIDRIKHPLRGKPLSPERQEAQIKKIISDSKAKLYDIAVNPGMREFVAEFFRENGRESYKSTPTEEDILMADILSLVSRYKTSDLMKMTDDELEKVKHQEELRRHSDITKIPSTELSIDPRQIPDNEYIEMLEHHIEVSREKGERIQNMISELMDGFSSAFKSTFKKDTPIDEYVIRERMQATEFVVVDALLASLIEIYGDCDIENERIRIAQQAVEDPKVLKRVFTHEMLHALSGRTMCMEIHSGDHDEDESEESLQERGLLYINQQRVGLDFGITEKHKSSDGKSESRFNWLNEAVTEELTGKIIGEKPVSYAEERQILRLLLRQGKQKIPFLLLVNAYFENFDPDAPSGQKIPHWKVLYKAVNDAYSPSFLLRLDKLIKEKGKQEAINLLKKSPESI